MASRGVPIRVGLLGYGLAGSVFHAPLITSTAGLQLTAVVTADPERQRRAHEDLPDTNVLPTSDQLWSMAGELDLAVIATPNRAHVPLALAALDAGLAVVIDKPMAPSADGGRAVLERAKARGRHVTVFQNRRWDGDFLTVRRLVETGELGRVGRFESRFERWHPTVGSGFRDSGDRADAGGMLFDLGAHLIDQAVQLFGPPTTLYTEADRRRAGATIDDDAFVALTHRSGTRSHLWMSASAAQVGPRFSVLGDRAGFVKWGLDPQEPALAGGARPGDAGFGEDPPERWGRLGVGADLRTVPTEPGRYAAFYAGVETALRSGCPMPVDAADSVAVLELIEAAHRSAATGCTVELDSP